MEGLPFRCAINFSRLAGDDASRIVMIR